MKILLSLGLLATIACTPPSPETAPAAVCFLAQVDTTDWRWVRADLVALHIPSGMRPDTGVAVALEFSHGGGRWLNDSLSVEYAPLGDSFQTTPPWTVPPGDPACWDSDGLEIRLRIGRVDGRPAFRAWVRPGHTSARWTFIMISGQHARQEAQFYTILKSSRLTRD